MVEERLSDEGIEGKVKALLIKSCKRANESMTLKYSFVHDLSMDSLDMLELRENLETEFGVIIPDGDVEKIPTIGSLIDYINKSYETETAAA